MNYLTKFIASRQLQNLMPMMYVAGANQAGLFRNFSVLRMAGEEKPEDTGENPAYVGRNEPEDHVSERGTDGRVGDVSHDDDQRLGSDFEQRDEEPKSHP